MAKKTKDSNLSIEERLEQALIPNWDEPYKLPDNWCWTKIGEITDLYRGVSYKKHEGHSEKGINDCLVMRGGNIQEGEIDTDADNIYVDKELVSEEQYVRKHDVVIVSSTGSTKVIGRAGISFADYEDVTFGAFLTLVRPNKSVHKPYISYYFQGDMYRNRMRQLASGVSINNIRNEYITDTPIPLPPLNEQKRIISHIESLFAKLDEAKEKAQEVIAGFETRKAAILQKAFSGELTAKWRKENTPSPAWVYLEELKNDDNYSIRSEIKYWNDDSLPAGWCESKIGNLLYFAGRIGWKGLKAEEYTTSGPLLLSVYNLNDGDEVTYNRVYHITQERYEESPEIMVEVGDVLLTKDGAGIGKLGYVKELPEKATINSSLLLLRPSKSAVSKYIYYVLLGPALQSIVKERITGSATPHLFQRDIKEFVLPIPSLEEQIEIVRVLDNMLLNENIAKESAELVLEQINEMKKSILVRAFRGELGTNDPTESSAIELIKQIIEEKIKAEESKPKRTPVKKKEVSFVAKTILEVLKSSEKLTPEKLKAETALEIDDFYDQLKALIDNGQIREIRIEGESYLEATK